MILKYLTTILLLFISQTICIDIKISFEKKNNDTNNKYPVVMTFKDNLIEKNKLSKINNIHLICIFDCIFEDDIPKHTKTIINSIFKTFIENDKLTIIKYHDDHLNINNDILDIYNGGYKLEIEKEFYTWTELLQKIENKENSTKKESYLINTIFFFTEENKDEAYINILKTISKYFKNDENDDYSLYYFNFNCKYPEKLANILYSKKGAFIPIDRKLPEKDPFILEYINRTIFEAISETRSVKYKINEITITINSKYQFYYHNKNITNKTEVINGDRYNIYYFPKYQFISGKEYTYVFEVDLEDIKYGERILYGKIKYYDLEGKMNISSSTSLKFYNSINYFNYKNVEFCKVQLMEALELFLMENKETKLIDNLKQINKLCGENFSNKFLDNEKIRSNDDESCKRTFIYISGIIRDLF